MIYGDIKPVEPKLDTAGGFDKTNIATNLKTSSETFGDVVSAAANEVIPFLRAAKTGTLFSSLTTEADPNFDLNSQEAKDIRANFDPLDWYKLNEAKSLTEMNNIAIQMESANRDAEMIEAHTNTAGALALYGVVGMLDPTSYFAYGLGYKVSKMIGIANKISKMSRTARMSAIASEAALVEGSSEAIIQSTGARDYENVGYTALLATVIGGGGYGIYDIAKKYKIQGQDDAIAKLANSNMNIKPTPEEAIELKNIFEQDMLAPIRSKALKAYDNTIGRILTNRFTTSPMMEAWRKGGIISAIASKFDTQVGLNKDLRTGKAIASDGTTAMDVKYELFKQFGEMERLRGQLYSKYLRETDGKVDKPMTPAEFSNHMYNVRESNGVKYREIKLLNEREIRQSPDDMKAINDIIQKRLEEKKDTIPEDELDDTIQEWTDIEISKLARDRVTDFELEGTDLEKAFINGQNMYFKTFANKLKSTGIDEYGALDYNLYTPRIYNIEYVKMNPLEASTILTKSIESSPEFISMVREAENEVLRAINTKKNISTSRKTLAKDNEATLLEIDKLSSELEELDILSKMNEEQYADWNFEKSRKGIYINSAGEYVEHPRLSELLDITSDLTSKDKAYSRRLVQPRSGNMDYNGGAVYEKNYSVDFKLNKTDVAKIKKLMAEGKKLTKALSNKVEEDLAFLDNSPEWQIEATAQTTSFRRIDNKRIRSSAERAKVDTYLEALDRYEFNSTDKTRGEVYKALEELYKFRKKSFKTRATNISKKVEAKRKEMAEKYSELDKVVFTAKKDLEKIKEYPKKSAEEMVNKLINLKNMSELEMDSLTPTRLKGRTMSINPISEGMDSVLHTNEAQLINAYQYNMSGVVAVKHATGHINKKDYIDSLIAGEKAQHDKDAAIYSSEMAKYKKDIETYRSNVAKGIKSKAPVMPEKIERIGLDKRDLAIAGDLFDLTKGTRQIPNNPDNGWEKAVRRISQYNYLTMGGQFAKYGLSELGAGVYSTGLRYFKELVPALDDVIKMYRSKDLSKTSNDSLRMIEAWEIFQHNSRAEYSDAEFIESMFSSNKIDKTMALGVEKMFRYSGLEAVTVLSKMALPRAFFGRIIDQAAAGKLYQPDLLRWGITPDDMIALSKENFILNEHGKLEDFNFDNWKDKKLADRFQKATTRMGRDTIMRPDAVRIPSWMTNRSGIDGQHGTHPIFLLAKQFMTFTALSHERLLIRGLNEKTAMATLGTITSAAILGMFTIMQDELAFQLGYQDKRKYDIRTPEGALALGAKVATTHSFAGIAGTAAETANAMLNPKYRSGEQTLTKVVGGATLSRAFGARNVINELIDGKMGTQSQVYFGKSLLIGNNLIGLGSILENEIIKPLIGKDNER